MTAFDLALFWRVFLRTTRYKKHVMNLEKYCSMSTRQQNPILTAQHNMLCVAGLHPLVVILHYYVIIFMSWAHHTAVWVLYVFHAIDPASGSSGPFGWGLMTEAKLIPRRNTHYTLLCRGKGSDEAFEGMSHFCLAVRCLWLTLTPSTHKHGPPSRYIDRNAHN